MKDKAKGTNIGAQDRSLGIKKIERCRI